MADTYSKGKTAWSFLENPFSSDDDYKNAGVKAKEEIKKLGQSAICFVTAAHVLIDKLLKALRCGSKSVFITRVQCFLYSYQVIRNGFRKGGKFISAEM